MKTGSYTDGRKLLKGLLGILVLYTILLNIAAGLTWEYTDYIAENPRDIEYPEQEFNEFFERNDIENDSAMARYMEERKTLEGLERRTVLHGFALADIGISGAEIFNYAGSGDVDPDLHGVFYRDCINYPKVNACERDIYYANMIGIWMEVGTTSGSIEAMFNSSEKREKIESFVERAHYYDRTLNTAYKPSKIVAASYSSEAGLYLVTVNTSSVEVDGDIYQVNDTITALDLSLEQGRHRIRADDQSIVLPVYAEQPESYTEGRSIILRNRTGEEDFREVTASRQNWSRTVRLRENGSKISVPERFVYQEESAYGTSTEIPPVKLNWSNEQVYVVSRVGSARHREIDYSYGFGMSRKEYQRINRIQTFLDRLPLAEQLIIFGSTELTGDS